MKPVGKEVSAVYPTSYRQSFLYTFGQTRDKIWCKTNDVKLKQTKTKLPSKGVYQNLKSLE